MSDEQYAPGTMRLTHVAFEVLRKRNKEFLIAAGYPDLGITCLRVLQHIVYSGTNLSEIARKSGISRQAVSKAAIELENDGYIVLQKSVEDARVLQANLTSSGKKLFKVLRQVIQQSEEHLARKLGVKKLETLRKLLKEVATS